MLGRAVRHRVVRPVTLRSPLTAFRGERLPGIGHNLGPPLDAAVSWRKFAWKKARRELLPRLPLEVIKRRVARAQELGLDYPQYASILLGTGRDIVAFLFTSDALGAQLTRTPPLPRPVVDKLARIERVDRLLTTEAHEDVVELADAIIREHRIVVKGVGTIPAPENTSWSKGRDAILHALRPLKIPGDAVVMVGSAAHERTWADAAKLAKFLPSDQFFPR